MNLERLIDSHYSERLTTSVLVSGILHYAECVLQGDEDIKVVRLYSIDNNLSTKEADWSGLEDIIISSMKNDLKLKY